MSAYKANLINAFTLIIIGLWGAYATGLASITALIPVVGGLILLLFHKGVANENKVIAHLAVLVTLVLIIGLVRPFMGAISDGDTMGIIRTSLMILTGILAMIAFIQSFINARKNRSQEDQT